MPKKTLLIASIITASLFCFTNVSGQKYYERVKKQMIFGRDSTKNVFLITNHGEMVTGNVISFTPHKKYKTFNPREEWIAIDGKQFMRDSVDAFQTEEFYKARFKGTPVLPGFPERLRYGKIDLYSYPYMEQNGTSINDYHIYFFKKGTGELQLLTYKDFAAALSDNPRALEEFKKSFDGIIPRYAEKENLEKLINVVEIYNK